MKVVCNSSAIIALRAVGRLDLLRDVFGQVVVPTAVARETFSPNTTAPSWIQVVDIPDDLSTEILETTLGRGESEVISLARGIDADCVVLDDLPARVAAQRLGLRVTGTLGLLVAAKRQGLLAAVQPVLSKLAGAGFHMSEHLRTRVLRLAGE